MCALWPLLCAVGMSGKYADRQEDELLFLREVFRSDLEDLREKDPWKASHVPACVVCLSFCVCMRVEWSLQLSSNDILAVKTAGLPFPLQMNRAPEIQLRIVPDKSRGSDVRQTLYVLLRANYPTNYPDE